MSERSLETLDFKTPKPRTILIFVVLFILFIISWGSFALVPAGHRGVVLLWGSVEKRIMGEGLNFKLPVPAVRFPFTPRPEALEQCEAFGRAIAEEVLKN